MFRLVRIANAPRTVPVRHMGWWPWGEKTETKPVAATGGSEAAEAEVERQLRAFYDSFDAHAADHSAAGPPALTDGVTDIESELPPPEIAQAQTAAAEGVYGGVDAWLAVEVAPMGAEGAAEVGRALIGAAGRRGVGEVEGRAWVEHGLAALDFAVANGGPVADDAAYVAGVVHAGAHPAASVAGDIVQPGKGARLLKSLAERGHPWAQYGLGQLVREGQGVKKNPAVALSLFELAANGGVTPAYHTLATMHADGEGVDASVERAVGLWEAGVKGGDPVAAYALAQHLSKAGDGAVEGRVKELLVMAAENGLARAAHDLGALHMLGKDGVEKDEARAAELFETAAKAGSVPSMLNLGMMYARGLGVDEDIRTAVAWYERAAPYSDDAARLVAEIEAQLTPKVA